MKHWWIALVFLVAIAGGALLLQRAASPAPSFVLPTRELPGRGVIGDANVAGDPYDATITYTKNGFSPHDITIQKGERVRFLNASSESFWPASGIHPTHTLYPEKEQSDCLGSSFDSCKDLQPGEFIDFTFNYTGSWPYHDHLHAYNSGSITVEQ